MKNRIKCLLALLFMGSYLSAAVDETLIRHPDQSAHWKQKWDWAKDLGPASGLDWL